MSAVPRFTIAQQEAAVADALDCAAARVGASAVRARFAKFTAALATFNGHSGADAYQRGVKTLPKRDPNFPSVA